MDEQKKNEQSKVFAATSAAVQYVERMYSDIHVDARWDYYRLESFLDGYGIPLLRIKCTSRPETQEDGWTPYPTSDDTMRKVITSAIFQAQCGFGVHFETEFVEAHK